VSQRGDRGLEPEPEELILVVDPVERIAAVDEKLRRLPVDRIVQRANPVDVLVRVGDEAERHGRLPRIVSWKTSLSAAIPLSGQYAVSRTTRVETIW
jgi:hypothetical protein